MLPVNWFGTFALIVLIAGITWISYAETHQACQLGNRDKH
ncbi:putative membrane protein [Synechococcus sp. ROS8604]|nr:putative membrane protein [Synechococcus sp. ROS8604]